MFLPKTKTLLIGAAIFAVVFAGTLILGGILPTSWVTALDNAGIVLGFVLACLATVTLALGIWRMPELRRLAYRWLRRRQFAHAGRVVNDFEKRVDAVVILLGLHATQAEWIVRHLKPQCVALVFTEQGRETALKLVQKFAGRSDVEFVPSADGFERQAMRPAMMLKDLLDLQDAKRLTRHYLEGLRERGFARERIFVDTSGGTAPMSMGAFQAAEEMEISSIYVTGKMSDGERQGLILDPEDPAQGEPRFMSDHTGAPA